MKSVTIKESSVSKVLAKLLLNRLSIHLDQTGLIPESLSGFRKKKKNRWPIDVIFRAIPLQENANNRMRTQGFFWQFWEGALGPFWLGKLAT